MGATVTNGKQVGAFVTASGKIGYLLFEGTYDKRGDSREPHWECVALGYLDEVLIRIFEVASICEGGCLQGPSGMILPESYIAGWLKELESPHAMHDFKGSLEISTKWGASLPAKDAYREETDLRQKYLSTLVEDGFAEIASTLENGAYEASLIANFDVLRSLYFKNRQHISPRRFVTASRLHSYPCPELGYRRIDVRQKCVEPPRMLGVVKTSEPNVLVEQPDGTYRCMGRGYSVVAEFVRSLGGKELESTGMYRSAIKAYRRATMNLPTAPAETRITLDTSLEDQSKPHSYWIVQIQTLGEKLGKDDVSKFETSLKEVLQKGEEIGENLIYQLTHSERQVWHVPRSVSPERETQENLFEDLMPA